MEDNVQSVEKVEEVKEVQESIQEQTYTKQAILNSKKYVKQKDLINALLDNDKKYTLKEVDSIIEKYLKGVIK